MSSVNTDTLYVKMKTENGSEVWRNVAPSVGTGTKRLNFDFGNYSTPTEFGSLINAFVPIQVEQLALDNGQPQYKVISEFYMTGTALDSTIPGTDAWTDTTDEKLVVSVTDGEKDGTAKLPRAASALGQGTSGSYEDAVSYYSRMVAQYYNLGIAADTLTWTQTHLTGTKDTLVAQNS